MDNKKNMPWWVIILIILGSLIGLIFLIASGKVIIGTIKSLNYAGPIIPMLAVILPLILGAGVSWWVAVQFIWFSMVLITIVSVTLSGSNKWIPQLTKLIPINVLALLSVLISIITNAGLQQLPTSLGMSTTGAVFTALYAVIGIFLLTLVGLGNGNFIAGAMYLLPFIKTFVWNNRVRVPVLFLFAIYAILSIFYHTSFTKDGPLAGWKTIMTIFNLMWTVLGVFLAIWVYAASTSYFPGDTGTWDRIKQIFTGSTTKKIAKIFGVFVMIGIAVALMALMTTSVPNFTTTLVQLITTLIVLYMILQYILHNPRILGSIMSNSFIKLIFHIVFTIPCIFTYIMEGSDGFMPSKSTWIVLFAEIVLIFLYILLPKFRKWFYLWTPFKKNRNSTKNQRMEAAAKTYHDAVRKLDEEITLKEDVDGFKGLGKERQLTVNWNDIYEVYEKKAELTAYLASKGYKNEYSKLLTNPLSVGLFGKPITLDEAVKFIQLPDKVKKVMKAKWNIENAEHKYKAIEKEGGKNDKGPFESVILLNKPYYINKIKYLGLYENLKAAPIPEGISDVQSGVADDYNYNYGLSCWVYILPQGNEYGVGYSQCTKVLDYGSKPTIWFNPDKNKLTITVKTKKSDKNGNGSCEDDIVYTSTDLPLQRWNNIVINYNGGILDIFINKKLVSSVKNLIPYMSPDNISIGDAPGISGSISAVVYFSQPISKNKMVFLYNSLVNKDPPII